ncbi:MAG TPA: DUF2059 domain-containing protein [Longimicrobiaceae bacterium]
MKRLACTLALLLACALPARAQTPAPSPDRVRAASELVESMDMEATLERSMETMLQQQVKQAPMMAQFQDIMREFMKKAMNWEELRGEYVRVYAEVYTVDELRQLRDFYGTPLGKRLLASMPEVMAKSSEITNARLQQYLPEMQQRIMERMSGSTPAKP